MRPTLQQLKVGESLLIPCSPQDKQRLKDWLEQHLSDTIKLAILFAKSQEAKKEAAAL